MAFLDADEFLVLSEIDAVRFLSNFEPYALHTEAWLFIRKNTTRPLSGLRMTYLMLTAVMAWSVGRRQSTSIRNVQRKGFHGGFMYETGYFAVGDSMTPVSEETNISTSSSWLLKILPQQRSHDGRGIDDVKTLVILWGEPRGGELAWKSIHKHLLKRTWRITY